MSFARDKATALLAQHGNALPCPLDRILLQHGLEVISYPFHSGLKELLFEDVIGISPSVTDERERRVLTIHALAHHVLHTGNHLVLSTIDANIVPRQEQGAREFTQELLIPSTVLSRCLAKCMTAEDIADLCQAPLWLVHEAIADLQQQPHWTQTNSFVI